MGVGAAVLDVDEEVLLVLDVEWLVDDGVKDVVGLEDVDVFLVVVVVVDCLVLVVSGSGSGSLCVVVVLGASGVQGFQVVVGGVHGFSVVVGLSSPPSPSSRKCQEAERTPSSVEANALKRPSDRSRPPSPGQPGH